MTMKAENDVLGRGLTLPTLYNIVQCRVLHKLVRVNYLSNVFLFLAVNRDKDFFSRMTQGDCASHSIQCFVIIFIRIIKLFYRINLTFLKFNKCLWSSLYIKFLS